MTQTETTESLLSIIAHRNTKIERLEIDLRYWQERWRENQTILDRQKP